jgi:hypothetical protein
MMSGITAVDQLIQTMAPVINANFASGFLTTQSPDRYMFERGIAAQNCGTGTANVNLVSQTCGLATGIDSMVKNYTGSTYTATTGDSITAGMYLFATTSYPANASNISATFNLVSGCGVSQATVIGESRNISITGCSFTDTFPFAWTTHIYKLH